METAVLKSAGLVILRNHPIELKKVNVLQVSFFVNLGFDEMLQILVFTKIL